MMAGKDAALRRTGQAATALRLAGASYAEVAEALGLVDAVEARNIVERDLATRSGDEPARNALRAEEEARILRLLRSVWRKATNENDPEHLVAARVALAMVDRHAKLMGLDMPTEVVVYTPTTSEIDAWVAEVVALQHTNVLDVEEADVLAIEA
jgi:transposase-like protein